MPLELISSLDQLSIPQLEDHLKKVRAERLILRIKYKKAKNVKLGKLRNVTEARFAKAVDLFGKDLDKLDEVLEKARLRLEQVTTLRNELGYISQAIEEE